MLIQCLCSRWLRGLIWGPGGVFFNKKGPKSLDTVPINYIFAHKLTQRCPGSGIVFFFYLFLAAKEGFSFFFEILQYYTMTLSGHSCSTKYLICLLYSAYCTYWGVEYWISLLYSAYCTGVWNIEYLSFILPSVLGCRILNISPLSLSQTGGRGQELLQIYFSNKERPAQEGAPEALLVSYLLASKENKCHILPAPKWTQVFKLFI